MPFYQEIKYEKESYSADMMSMLAGSSGLRNGCHLEAMQTSVSERKYLEFRLYFLNSLLKLSLDM